MFCGQDPKRGHLVEHLKWASFHVKSPQWHNFVPSLHSAILESSRQKQFDCIQKKLNIVNLYFPFYCKNKMFTGFWNVSQQLKLQFRLSFSFYFVRVDSVVGKLKCSGDKGKVIQHQEDLLYISALSLQDAVTGPWLKTVCHSAVWNIFKPLVIQILLPGNVLWGVLFVCFVLTKQY